MNRTFVMGDIHGELDKLKSCLNQVNFDFENDTLIQLGDVVDRGLYSFECVDLLLKCKNLIAIKGNHDHAFYEGLLHGKYTMMNQGCKETIESYIRNCNPDREFNIKLSGFSTDFCLEDIPPEHYEFFKNQLFYHVDKDNNCFIHGGFNRHHLITQQPSLTDLIWDRDLLASARSYSTMKNNEYPFKMKNNFKEVFVGHTPVQYFNETTPQKYANIWDLDCGSGKFEDGTVAIMNLETKEIKQSL